MMRQWRLRLKGCFFMLLLGVFCRVEPVFASAMEKLQPYPDASLVEESESPITDYRLTLGALKKINNRWRAEREERLGGDLVRKTWELPRDHTAEEGYRFFLTQLTQLGYKELYSCQSRACGSSSSWANNRFGIKQLYGLDRYQLYGAYRLSEEGRSHYVSLYSVRRGNKRVYVHAEILSTTDISESGSLAADWGEQWKNRGFISVPVSLQDEAVTVPVARLVEFLQALPAQSLAVVGHDLKGDSPSQQRQRSLDYARQVIVQLKQAGLDQHQLQAHGLGGLAPAGKELGVTRVDLVPSGAAPPPALTVE